MRKSVAAVAMAMAVVAGDRAQAGEHLVTTEAARARLAEAEAARQSDLALVDRALSSPEAAAAARTVGADLDAVRRAAPLLSDAELRDLAARAAALDRDPVAGLDSDIRWLLIVFLIVAIVILVLQAVD